MHRDSKGDFYMLKDAIYHRPKIITHTLTMKNDSHPNTYERDDIQSTTLIYGDPYEWTDGKWISSSAPMKNWFYCII